MTTQSDQLLSRAQEASESWIAASFAFRTLCKILDDAGEPDPNGWTKGELLHQLAHLQYGTALSFSRLRDSAKVANPPPDGEWSFAPLLARAADAHHLLVSASGFWSTLQQLCDLIPFRELKEVLDGEADTITATRIARNHVEHIAERITEGRRGRRRVPEVSKEAFQKAVGRMDFPDIVFGPEAFNLEIVASSIMSAGSRLSVAFQQLFESAREEFYDVAARHAARSG